jgi:hypothetical protein
MAAVRTIRDGRQDWRELGNDRDAVAAFVAAGARELGTTVDALTREFARGRPTAAEVERYEQLARVVVAGRARGASLETLGEALGGRSKPRMVELEQRGQGSWPLGPFPG